MTTVTQREGLSKRPKTAFGQTMYLMTKNTFEHNVGKSAAALAYYLLFSTFPLLIFLSNLLGLLELDVGAVTEALSYFMPKDVVGLIENYLEYISHTSSQVLLWFALVFSVWFPMRAVKGIMENVRLAYQLDKPKRPVSYAIRQFLYTVVFLIILTVTLLLSTMGRNILSFLFEFFPDNAPRISNYLLSIWQYIRFILAALLMFIALGALYAMSMDEKKSFKALIPGICAALLGWMAVSVGFSFYVENFANYSIIYGTLGAVIVLMLWLYITSLVLILGAELNSAIESVRCNRCADEEENIQE